MRDGGRASGRASRRTSRRTSRRASVRDAQQGVTSMTTWPIRIPRSWAGDAATRAWPASGNPGWVRLCSRLMRRLLFVHHTPSPAMQAMFEAVQAGAHTDEIEGVEVVVAPALTAGAADVLNADGYLLGTPANIGYMSRAL